MSTPPTLLMGYSTLYLRLTWMMSCVIELGCSCCSSDDRCREDDKTQGRGLMRVHVIWCRVASTAHRAASLISRTRAFALKPRQTSVIVNAAAAAADAAALSPRVNQVSVAEWLARLIAVREDRGSNHTAGGCVYRDSC